MDLFSIGFYFFSLVAIGSAIMVIGAKNPIHSILFLILVFCNASGLLLLLKVEFLAMLFLVVYVGAVAVLFLFVVMMLNIKLVELNENLVRYVPVGAVIAVVFLLEVFLIIDSDLIPLYNFDFDSSLRYISYTDKINVPTNVEALGNLLYTHYFYLFLAASMVLLVSMVGAIVLTLKHRKNVKRQEIYQQVSRSPSEAIRLV